MKNKIQKFIATLIITTLSVVFCNSFSYATNDAFAITDAEANLGSTTFDLNKHLTAEGQDSTYLDKGSPIKTFIFERVIDPAIKLMGSIAVLLVIIGGFTLITAQGESEQVDKGKDIIKYALIGLVVALLSYVIVASIQTTLVDSNDEATEAVIKTEEQTIKQNKDE